MTSTNTLLHLNDRDGHYPESYYAASANPCSDYPALEGDIKCDVVVVGGGFTGLSSALHLAEHGYDVVLLEAHKVGWGASGRNGGQIGTGQRRDQDDLEEMLSKDTARQAWNIAEEAKSVLTGLIDKHNIACDYKPGCLHANHKKRYDIHSKRFVELLNEHYDYDKIRYIEPQELREMVGTEDYSAGTLDMGAGHIHPLNFALGIATAASSASVRIFENSEVLETKHGEPVNVRTAKGNVKARFLVYACNGYLGGLSKKVGRHVMPINNYVIATGPLSDERARSLIRDDVCVADSRFVVNYYRLSADKRMLFGGGESYGYRFPKDIKSFVRRHMLKIYPQLDDVRIDYGWGGTLAITMSRLPYFQRLSGNVLSASGYSGSGVALATCAGSIIADAIHGNASRFDVMSSLPTPGFPGGSAFRSPLLMLGLTWYALRDRL